MGKIFILGSAKIVVQGCTWKSIKFTENVQNRMLTA